MPIGFNKQKKRKRNIVSLSMLHTYQYSPVMARKIWMWNSYNFCSVRLNESFTLLPGKQIKQVPRSLKEVSYLHEVT